VLYQRRSPPSRTRSTSSCTKLGHIISDHGGDEDDDDLWKQIFPTSHDVVLRALRREATARGRTRGGDGGHRDQGVGRPARRTRRREPVHLRRWTIGSVAAFDAIGWLSDVRTGDHVVSRRLSRPCGRDRSARVPATWPADCHHLHRARARRAHRQLVSRCRAPHPAPQTRCCRVHPCSTSSRATAGSAAHHRSPVRNLPAIPRDLCLAVAAGVILVVTSRHRSVDRGNRVRDYTRRPAAGSACLHLVGNLFMPTPPRAASYLSWTAARHPSPTPARGSGSPASGWRRLSRQPCAP